MSEYNIEMADKAFISKAAYLARDLDYDPENPPTSRQVELWRLNTMEIIQQHQVAHKSIRELKTKISEVKTLCDLSDMHKSTLTREAYLMQRIELISKTIGE